MYIPSIFLLYPGGSLFGVPSKVKVPLLSYRKPSHVIILRASGFRAQGFTSFEP